MGNLNDLLVSGDQTSTTDEGAGGKPDIYPPASDLATFQRARMGKVSPDKTDERSIEVSEIDKAPDKTSAAYAPKKKFLKDYQTEGSLSSNNSSANLTLIEKVSVPFNVVSKHAASAINSAARPSLETMNISSCIGVIVESELTKYEMSKDNSDAPRLNEKSVLPLLFTPYSDQTSDNFDDKYSQRSQEMTNISKDKLKSFGKISDQSLGNVKQDIEIIACSPEIPSQQRHEKVKLSEIEKGILSTSKSRELIPYEASGVNKSYSPKLYRASPQNVTQTFTMATHVSQGSQYLDEWRNLSGSEKGSYSFHNSPYGMKPHYLDIKLSKVQDLKSQSHVQFKAPSDLNQRRAEVQFSPKHLRHQSPREISSSDNLVAMTYAREEIQGHSRGIDARFYPNLSGEKYVHHSTHSSPQIRSVVDETPIDLRIKKKEKPLGYSNVIPYESLEGKRHKFHNFPYDQSIKTSGQYYYFPADTDKGHHGCTAAPSLSYNPSFLKTGEAETLKTYLSDQYNHSFNSRHAEVAISKPKMPRLDGYPYRESYGTSKVPEENLNKSQMLEKWDRGIPRSSDQARLLSRRQQEAYEQEIPGSHYVKYFEANRNQDQKSSSPRLIPQLLPIPSMNHVQKHQPLNYMPPHDSQSFQCKLCNSVHNSYRSFRMHIVKDHNMEPHPEHCSLSVADAKSNVMYGPDRVFPTHKARQEGDGFHISTPKQVAEVYPIISKVQSAYTSQGGMSGNDHADPKNKNPDKSKTDKSSTNKDGIEDLKQVISWDCRHQLVIDSEMNCTTCMEGFQDITDWRAHISSMHMVRSCACRTCNKWFANAEELNKHLQGVHSEHRQVDVEYRCLYCRKAFTDEEVLYIHTREHERALSISRNEAKPLIKGDIEIQKAVPDTTCPESDQKVLSDTCDMASTISPMSDCDQEKLSKVEELKSLENWRAMSESDLEKAPSSKKSFFLKKFQREEMNMSIDPDASKNKPFISETNKSKEQMLSAPQQKIVTARSIIDSLVTEGLTRNTNLAGLSKMPMLANQSRHLENRKTSESKAAHDVCGQSPEFLLANTSEHNQKQPLLKDMLLQINSKSHLSFGNETKPNSSQPRTKCVRDICDEIITHSFRESSPVGPTERLKIFDSIAFDTVPRKIESPPCSKSVRGTSVCSSKTPTDSNVISELREVISSQDSHNSLVDSTDKASSLSHSSVVIDSKKPPESPELVKQSCSPPIDGSKVSADVDPDADSTCKATAQKDSRTSPTQSILGKRNHSSEAYCQESNLENSAVLPANKNNAKDGGENEEPPCKKLELQR